MVQPASATGERARDVLVASARTLLAEPRQLLAFLLGGVLVSSSLYASFRYSGQFEALASQLLPRLFEHRLALLPRAHVVLPLIAVLVIATVAWVLTSIALGVRLADAAFAGQSPSFWDELGKSVVHVPPVAGVLVLLTASIAAGFVALVLPGLYLSVRLFAALPAAVLGRCGPFEALRESWRRTRGLEPTVAIVVLALAIAWILLNWIPLGGNLLAVALVAPTALAASVATYRLGGDEGSIAAESFDRRDSHARP